MADEKGKVSKISWTELVKQVDTNQGVSAKTVQESFEAVNREVTHIIKESGPKKVGDVLVIKTPIAAIGLKFIPEHQITDEKGKKFKITQGVGVSMTPPNDYVTLANDGFKMEKKAIE
jgi:hypothetical protein